MFEDFKKWFKNDWSKAPDISEKTKNDVVILWVDADTGKEISRGKYNQHCTVIPSVGSTAVMKDDKHFYISGIHYNYKVDTTKGDHVFVKLKVRNI